VRTPKLLGVTLNHSSGFGSSAPTQNRGRCKHCVGGLHPDFATVESSLLYACPSWWGAMYHSDLELLSSAQAKGAKGVVGLPATVTNQSLLEAGPGPLATRAKYATYKYYLLTQLRGGSQKECADKCFPESSGAVDRRMAARPFCARAPLRMRLPSGNACFPPGEQAFQRPAVPAERPIGRRPLPRYR
jgi:hypothetical protein